MIRLREIAKVTAGQAAPKEFADEGYPFIRAGHLKGLLSNLSLNDIPKVSEEVAQKKRLKKIPKGTILFAKSGMSATKNRVYITEKESYFVSHLAGILPSEGFSNSYLARFLTWYKPSKLILDSAYPSIRLEDINNLSIPLPPLDQQKKIAAILDAADAYRQKTKALIEKYDELTQSLFLDMFGDPVSNSKKLPKIKLGKLGKWQSGGTPSRSNSAYYDGEIPWLSSGELNQMYISDSKEHITEQAIKESNTKLIAKGSILLGMYDTAALKSTINTEVVSCNQAIAYCKLDDRLVNTSFVYNIIQIGKEHYRRLQRGVRQKNLNLSMVKGIEILFPPIKLQNQFADRVQAIEAQKAQAQASLAQAEDLFNSLLQRAFKGELS